MAQQWCPVMALSSLPVGAAHVFKSGDHQVAVFRLQDGTLHAVDNRCPHEGYPLAQGTVTDCVLTCDWHNFKFDLRDGRCLIGNEAVRSFAVRVEDGTVEVDLSAPDPQAALDQRWSSLDEGLHEHRPGQVARDVVRLLELGVEPAQIAAHGAAWDALHAEYGPSHGLPLCADVLRWRDRYPGARAAIPLSAALDMVGDANVRRPRRARLPVTEPGPDPEAAGAKLRSLVETEQALEAEALLRGAIARGWGPAEIYPWCWQIVSDHFLDFGHQLIYLVKLQELLEQAGWQHADPILSSWVFGVSHGTREDRLPEWKTYREHIAALSGRWPALWTGCSQDADGPWDGAAKLGEVLLDGTRAQVFALLLEGLRARAPLGSLVDTLARAAATRMLRFDPAHDLDLDRQDSWLSVTHIQTFTAALRQALQRGREAELLRLLFQAAMFIHKGRPLDRPSSARLDTTPTSSQGVEGLLRAIKDKRCAEAVGQTAAWLASGEELQPLREALETLAMTDPAVRPIVVAHVIKNTVVAFEEHQALDDPTPVLALVALLASPMRERRVLRVTREAIAFVTEGKVPNSVM